MQPGSALLAILGCLCRVPPTSRLAQIVRWLKGSDAPPLLVFDEARAGVRLACWGVSGPYTLLTHLPSCCTDWST